MEPPPSTPETKIRQLAKQMFANQDVPDVLGDRANHIRSLSVRIGPRRALQIAAWFKIRLLDEPLFCWDCGSLHVDKSIHRYCDSIEFPAIFDDY